MDYFFNSSDDDDMKNGSDFTNSSDGYMTCAAKTIQGPVELPYSMDLITSVEVILMTFNIAIYCVGFSFNGFVVFLVAKYKKLHTRSFAASLQVVVLNLVLLFFLCFLRPVTMGVREWVFGEVMCILTGFFYFMAFVVRAMLMFTFVVDRFLSIYFPYCYPKHSVRIISILSIVAWSLGAISAFFNLPGIMDCYGFVPYAYLCSQSARCNLVCSIFSLIFLGSIYLPCTTIPIFLYGAMYYKARKAKESLNNIAPAPVAGEVYTSDIPRGHKKATITFFLLFTTVFLLMLPALAITAILTLVIHVVGSSPVVYVFYAFSTSSISLLSITDPIVIMRDKDVKEALTDLKKKIVIKFCCCRNQI